MVGKDYSFEIAAAASQNIKERDYWLAKLSGIPVKTCIPYDFKKETDSKTEAEPSLKTAEFSWEGDVFNRLLALSSGSDYTLQIVLAAVLTLLLDKYTGQQDILIGSPIYKQKKESQFINTILVFRNLIHPRMTFKDLLLQTKQNVIEAVEHQNYPIQALTKRLNLPTQVDKSLKKENPFFDIALVLENLQDKHYLRDTAYNILLSFLRTEKSLEIRVEYNPYVYQAQTIDRLIGHLSNLIQAGVANVNSYLEDMEIMSEEEKKRILTEFCGSSKGSGEDYTSSNRSVIDLFLPQVKKNPEHIALVGNCRTSPGAPDGTSAFGYVTYHELNRQADRLAVLLKSKGVKPDTIVAVILPPTLDMIITLWGILKSGGAYLPIAPECPAERIAFMLKDSGANILVSKESMVSMLTMTREACQVIDIGDIGKDTGAMPIPGHPLTHLTVPPDLAYIIYTSGSTGKPKGVLVEHGNLLNYLFSFYREFDMKATDTVIHLSDYTFDAFVEEMYPVLLRGGRLALPGENEYLDMTNLGSFIHRHNVSFIDCSPLLLNQLNQLEPGYLSGVHTYISGGDVLRGEYVDRLLLTGQVYNTYGPTETTVCATYYRYGGDTEQRTSIPLGKPIANYRVCIMSEGMGLLPVGIIGEICISGPGVTRGYLNRPELTAERFIPIPFKNHLSRMPYMSPKTGISYKSDTIYKSGDLGRWLPDGGIEYHGRKDLQVKIRGFRIETGEIETLLIRKPEIKEAAVIAREGKGGEKYLCAYYVLRQKKDAPITEAPKELNAALKQYLNGKLPDFMIPSFFVELEQLPLLSSGKVDRKALPEPKIKTSVEYAAPGNPIEKRLEAIWREVFDLERIGIDDNFFEIGGHSLRATVMISKIHQVYNINLPLAEVFKSPTIRQLAQYIESKAADESMPSTEMKGLAGDRFIPINPVEKKEYYPLSSTQKRLLVLQQMEPASTVYNMPHVIPLEESFTAERIEKIFSRLIQRHESFRTSFQLLGTQPVQRIWDRVEFQVDYMLRETGEESSQSVPDLIKEFVRPFDISRAPLLRVGIIKMSRPTAGKETGKNLLMLDMHHIITDGLSYSVLEKDLRDINRDMALSPLRIQYKDFSQWQNSEPEKQKTTHQESFWLQRLAGEIPLLNLPTDFPRPQVQSFNGNVLEFEIDTNTFNQLKAAALKRQTTIYMVTLTVFNMMLAKLCNQEDIVIGTPIAGRRHPDLENIIGMFVNTLALRNYPVGNLSSQEFLAQVKAQTLAAFENQEYPFEELVDKLAIKRDTSRNPLFDVMFSYHSNETEIDTLDSVGKENREKKPGSETDEYVYESRISKFDLTLHALESKTRLHCAFQYCTALFKEETIKRYIYYFNKIITTIIDWPDMELGKIEILSEIEQKQLLIDFNRTDAELPTEKTIQRLFWEQAERTPDNIVLTANLLRHQTSAVVPLSEQNSHLTYHELNRISDRLAVHLHNKEDRSHRLVGLRAEKSLEMIIAMLGILKAGNAYIPLNPQTPTTRTVYMLEECQANLLLTNRELPGNRDIRSTWPGGTIIALDNEELDLRGREQSLSPGSLDMDNATPSDLAYIIFTSGSTGKPKGVPISHANFSPLLHWGYKHFSLESTDRTLQNLAYYFDWSVWEIFITITSGAVLYPIPDELLLNPELFGEFMDVHDITVLHITPTQYRYLLHTGRKMLSLKYLCLGAEKFTHDLVERSVDLIKEECRIYNMYGPTEATIVCAVMVVTPADYMRFSALSGIPIGTPVGNTTLLILDNYFNLCPVYTAGELYIAGDGLSGGYLNKPELTAERFIPIPIKYPLSHKTVKSYKSKTIYKTGDLTRWLPDGNIEYLGRIDFQVKIRGNRIELGEIEHRLLLHPQVKEAVVIDRENPQQEKYLCAYIIPTPDRTFDQTFSQELKHHLAQTLPDYMIPAHFVGIESLPLTPNRKIDRRALPLPENIPGSHYVAPRDDIEKQLVEIWAEVLGTGKESSQELQKKISIDDNFFDLGGHSLKATAVISGIRKGFNREIPLIEVFKTPVIRSLAELIRGEKHKTDTHTPGNKEDNLVLLKPGTDESALLFLVHDGTGEVEGYIESCNYLPETWNVWGIRADHLEKYTPANVTIEEIARRYIGLMKTIRAEGPYHLAGWSLGGTIAFEMTRQLEQQNQKVQTLALIDTLPPMRERTSKGMDFTLETEKALLHQYFPDAELHRRINGLNDHFQVWPTLLEYLRETHYPVETLKSDIPETLRKALPNFSRLGIKELIYYLNMERMLDNARNKYIPAGVIDTPVQLFKAAASYGVDAGKWQPYCHTVTVHEIGGDHYSIFKKPIVKTFTNVFVKVLGKT